jgi:antitoxin Phd
VKTLTSVEARSRFGELLVTAQCEPVAITRRGRTVAIVLSVKDMEELVDARSKRQRAVAAFEGYFSRIAPKIKPVATGPTEEDVNKLLRGARSAGR